MSGCHRADMALPGSLVADLYTRHHQHR